MKEPLKAARAKMLVIGTPWFCEVPDEVLGRDADGEVFVVAQLNPLAEMPDEVTNHHARLIAAAPEMLKLVDDLVAFCVVQGWHGAAIDAGNALLVRLLGDDGAAAQASEGCGSSK